MADDEASRLIAAKIRDGGPWCCGRLGTPECNALLNTVEIEWCESPSLPRRLAGAALGLRRSWDENVIAALHNNVGVFPKAAASAEEFCARYAEGIGEFDAVGYWGIVPGESYLLRKLSPKTRAFSAAVLEPYLNPEQPWSSALEGKKVLVLSPFAESIERQYRHRERLFSDARVLPEFELRTVRAVQSLAGTPTDYRDWMEALAATKKQIDRADFDVLLVGAGAYSVPACRHAKRSGKVAIYIGGALQILFGIRGKRWDGMPQVSRFYNDAWVRPAPSETIPGGEKVEGGCYW